LSFGNPKIPQLTAGIEIDFMPYSFANLRTLRIAFLSFSSSLPSPNLGPTVWITYFAFNRYPFVITASPTGIGPLSSTILSLSF